MTEIDPNDARIKMARDNMAELGHHDPTDYRPDNYGWYVTAFEVFRRDLARLLDVIDGKNSGGLYSHRHLLSVHIQQRARVATRELEKGQGDLAPSLTCKD